MPTLTWLTREADIAAASRAPWRLLEEAPGLSAGDPEAPNMIIQGDNLEALKALLPFYAGRVKCVYIDPPYNTRSAFAHYEDSLEHTRWIAMMWPRLELLRDLLAEDGSIWVQLDDNEAHYLKVIMDEIFARRNFVANVVWQKRTSPDARLPLGDAQDHIMVYAKESKEVGFNKLPLSQKQIKNYKNPDNDPRGPWASSDYSAQGYRPHQMYTITTPAGVQRTPPPGMCWKNVEEVFLGLVSDNRIWFGKDGRGVPRRKTFLSEREGISAWTWWENDDAGHNQEAKKEINQIFGSDNPFDTPKPERLLQRILHLATNPGDLVLDSFLGSGTTAAVAHKMGRRWIGVEMGAHAETHCVPRMEKVIEGEGGGISRAVGWRGGGGFRFHRLGPPAFDEAGRIRPDIRFPVLAAHVWFAETGRPRRGRASSPFLGVHEGRGYALLYNGVLGDRRANGGNVLTRATLGAIRAEAARSGEAPRPLVVYGEGSRLPKATLDREGVSFRQTPYEALARGREGNSR